MQYSFCKSLLAVFFMVLLVSCRSKTSVDLLVTNATIYTVDSSFSIAEAMAIKDGKIVETGSSSALRAKYSAKETMDAKGQFIYPGFIDAHCHFLAYGKGLNECNVTGTKSWGEVLDSLQAFAKSHPDGWLIGRGWDQNDWAVKDFPTKERLDSLFPNRPVLVGRIDGHAAIANQTALDSAGIKTGQQLIGGEFVMANNKLTGLLIDNAVDLVEKVIPASTQKDKAKYLQDAQAKCFAVGLTSVQDCGLDAADVEIIKNLYANNLLQMRMYVMLSDKKANYEYAFKNGKIKTAYLSVGAFKLYADGALGSRGACLLQPYSDKANHYGFLLKEKSYFDSILPVIASHGWQACTHAIGDSANRVMLNLYAKILGGKNDSRWRIEHAQVLIPSDLNLFGDYNIVPSVQPTHATSDMYWAGERLGAERLKYGYTYKQLLQQNNWLPLGTDFPVEDISPFKTFYAAVVRKDANGFPANGFQTENAVTREEAIRGMTIWAAKAAFEEKEKGSLEKGKYADFIILDNDIMKVTEAKLLKVKVVRTISAGKVVY